MIDFLNDYDWAEVFGCSGEENHYNYQTPSPVITSLNMVSEEPFTREDVIEVYGYDEGENDGADWLIAGLLKDGRHFVISAGCDYTGWD